MNVKTALKLIVITIVAGFVTSCNNSRNYDKTSRGTDWDITGEDVGPNDRTKFKEQATGPGLVFIEGGTFTMGRVADDPMHDWNNTPVQMTVNSFYMDETEVTNNMYLEYLDWIKVTFPPSDEKYAAMYEGAVPDTLVWRTPLGDHRTYVESYLRHPAYRDYPVVGVSWIQANEYSKWRTNRVNEKAMEDAGYLAKGARFSHDQGTQFDTEAYLAAPSLTYGGNDSLLQGKNSKKLLEVINNDTVHKYVQQKDGVLLPPYRLPTEAEWEYAALGMSSVRDYNNYRGRKKYPWDGSYTHSTKRKTRGDQLANFKQGYGDYSGIAGWSSDGAMITNEIKSYPPNDYGLYDMAGNVAEWVADIYRDRVDMKLNDFNYYRGNHYTQNVLNEDGTVQLIDYETIEFDTLRTGRIAAIGIPGEIRKEDVDDDQLFFRTNYDRSDNRDYGSGDKQSSRFFMHEDPLTDTPPMYNSPRNSVYSSRDSLGNVKIEKDVDTRNRTTLISDRTRVVKGGSWKDNAYWLDPAQRRFYPEDMATNWIGFRNAMSRLGSGTKQGKRPRG